MKTLFALTLALFSLTAISQPVIQWQNTIGGNSGDALYSIYQTADGGYILGGVSGSNISGDKTENSLGVFGDYWVVKLNNSGTIEWQNTIGGDSLEQLVTVQQTADGGYILAGYSHSKISGDKTENGLGGYDYWVVKLNGLGNIQWQNTIGGSLDDYLYYVQQTGDGGYILGGYSDSNISGDKTENSLGGWDYWVVKLNGSGNIQWQNTIGGGSLDPLFSLQQTTDGGYILGGYSISTIISGDKTENNVGSSDYWIVKLDVSGNIQWQNTIGGSLNDYLYSIRQTADGGYILGGQSQSPASGDKTENGLGDWDYWIVKLNVSGNIQWQNTIGGSGTDYMRYVQQTADGGYILGGYSNSPISGDKTENNFGNNYDYWILKLDASGNIQWQNTIGGNGGEDLYSMQQTADRGYILGGTSGSNISGDKSENSMGGSDYWVVKLLDTCTIVSSNVGVTTDSIFICRGDTAHLNAYGGISYNWSPTTSLTDFSIPNPIANPTVSTTYNVVIQDSFCFATLKVAVLIQNNAGVAFNSVTICQGDTAQLTAFNGISYSWFPATSLSDPSIPNPIANPSVPTTYNVIIQDSSFCVDTLTVNVNIGDSCFCLTANAGVIPDSSISICLGDTVQLSAFGGTSYHWFPTTSLSDPSIPNPLASPSVLTTYYVNIQPSCGDSFAVTIIVDTGCLCLADACVWPGDANADGIANNQDVLAIGIGYGISGFTRPNASLNWEGQPSPDWALQLAGGANLKHVDCNGDAIINASDTLAISLNYGLVHAKSSGSGLPTDPPLYVDLPDTLYAGQTVSVPINLGSASNVVTGIYGIAFGINYNTDIVDTNSVDVSYDNSWMGTAGVDLLGFSKDFYPNAKTDVAITRINHLNAAQNYGQIGTFSFTIKDDVSGKRLLEVPFEISIDNVTAIDKDENLIPVSGEKDSSVVVMIESGVTNAIRPFIRIYPNPADEMIYMEANEQIHKIILTDMIGRKIRDENIQNSKAAFDIKAFSKGTYLLRLEFENSVEYKKILIQ